MSDRSWTRVRVLVVEDDVSARETFAQVLLDATFDQGPATAFGRASGERPRATSFEPCFCSQAAEALALVEQALAHEQPFGLVFIDSKTSEHDVVWAAARIRELDADVEIAICTSGADFDACAIGGAAPPEDKLSFLPKPLNPREVWQLAIALGSKWRAERRIVRLAYFDALTGLPNREQFRSRLSGALKGIRQSRGTLAVLYLDLDGFKRVNDALGHAAGDELLCVVAERLRNSVRSEQFSGVNRASRARPGDVARLGGDEFAVMLPDLGSDGEACAVAERLVRAVRQPIVIGTHSVVIALSIGIAVAPRDGFEVDPLMRHADLAMYFAKRERGGSYVVFDPAMSSEQRPNGVAEHTTEATDCEERAVEFDCRIGQALAVLAAFSTQNRALTLDEVAAATDMTPTSALPSIYTLLRLGYLSHHERPRSWTLSTIALMQA